MVQALLALALAFPGIGPVPGDYDASHHVTAGAHHESEDYSTALPPPPHDRLVSSDVGLDTGVGVYGDCSGASELTHVSAAIDSCQTGRNYFIGHNPGVFSPLVNMKVGGTVTYYDATGLPHPYRIVGVRTWNRFWGSPPLVQPDVTAQFQTCLTLDAVWDQILDAVPA
jgi:hypothetical protein